MNSFKALLSLSLLLFLLNACAFTPQKTTLQPLINVTTNNIGNGISVSVTVVDERSSKDLGHRGGGYGKGALITTDQDVVAIIAKSIIEGLKKKGFNTNSIPGSSQRSLKVEIRLIEYETFSGLFTGGIQIKAILKALANNNGKNYENLYRVENEKSVFFVPIASTNEQWINEAVSEVIQKLIDDTALINHLST